MTKKYFEDLELGFTVITKKLEVNKDELIAFAKQFDPQPMHVDEEAAKTSFFRTLVGSGWHTLGLTMRLVVQAQFLGATPLVGVHIDDIKFYQPLLPGSAIWAKAEIVDLRESQRQFDRGYAKVLVKTFVDEGNLLASHYWTLLVPRSEPRGSLREPKRSG